jgi:signal transduction histidine kinase/ligand-binding sensor domain-containing protein
MDSSMPASRRRDRAGRVTWYHASARRAPGRPLRASLLLVAVMTLVEVVDARADTPGLVSGYTVSSWTLADGVPIGPIYAIVQDADGYLWLGTARGVVRFDGARFTPWDALYSTPLPRADALALSVSPDRTLWVGFSRSGGDVTVAALRQGRITSISAGNPPRGSTSAIVADRRGRVWAVSDDVLYRLRDGRWDVVRGGTLGTAVVLHVREDAAGTVWIGTRAGLFRTEDGETYELVEPGMARDASEGADGTLWVADSAHVVRARGAAPQLTNVDGRGMRLLHDARGNLWAGTTGQGLWRLRSTAATTAPLVERLTTQTGLSSNVVQSMLEDREGNVWVGTMLGLHSLTPQELTPVATDTLAQALLPDHDGSMWVGTANGLLQFRQEAGAWRSRRVDDRRDIQALFRDPLGQAWARTAHGLRAFMHGRLGGAPPARDIAPLCTAGAVMVMGDSLPVASRDASSGAERPPVAAVNQVSEAGPMLRPICTTKDAVWTGGTADTLIARHGERTLASIRLPSPPANVSQRTIDTIFEDAEGTLWAGSTAGLWRIREGHAEQLGEREGLPAQRVMAITQSTDGFLWLAVDRGPQHPGRRAALVRLHPSDVDRRAATKGPLDGYKVYDAINGLAGVAIGTATAARSVDGSLWFIIGGSLTVVDPRHIAHGPPRPIVAQIASATVDDRLVATASTSALAAGTRKLQIDYTALRLTGPGWLRFRYRLDGFDRDWVEAGARRQAYYTNLAPGNYVFRVQADGDGTQWTVPEARWQFTVQPAFHQTRWFYALSGVGVLLLAAAAAQTRVWILNRQFTATLAERTRLSREIHDTMLQSLAGIALQVQGIARQCVPQAATQREQLLALRREVEEHIREARQAVLNLRSPMLESCGLAGALREIGTRVIAPPARLEVTAGTISTSAAVEGELLRIGQEAITNAARHGGATDIRVDLRQESDVVRLRVTDNGGGFDVDAVTAGNGHYGLLGMRERAERLGGRLTITSGAGGTVIEASVPCAPNHQ